MAAKKTRKKHWDWGRGANYVNSRTSQRQNVKDIVLLKSPNLKTNPVSSCVIAQKLWKIIVLSPFKVKIKSLCENF